MESWELEARQEPILPPPMAYPRRALPSDVQVLGQDDLLTSMARCCTPVPGDDIVGFITRSRGVTVHRADCPNMNSILSAVVVCRKSCAPSTAI